MQKSESGVRSLLDEDGASAAFDASQQDKDVALEKLKSLLLSQERESLGSIEHRMAAVELFQRNLDARRDMISDVLVPALEQTVHSRRADVSAALAPVIGPGIRHEMENSREEMVAALHPLAGRLVASAVSDAFVRLTEQVNQSLEALMSPRGLKLRLKAALTGQSFANLLLSELRRSELRRIYLFERRSMALKFIWPDSDDSSPPSARTVDLIRNTLQVFADMVPDGDEMPLRSLDLDGMNAVAQGSAAHLVVIESDGALTSRRCEEMSGACRSLLDFAARNGNESGAELNAAGMAVFAGRLARQGSSAKPSRFNPAYLIGGALLCALAGYIGWRSYDAWRLAGAAEAVETRLVNSFREGELVLDVETDAPTGTIAVSGIGFSSADISALRRDATELAAPYDLDFSLVVRDPGQAERRYSAMEARLARAQEALLETRQLISDLSLALAEQGERILRVDPLEPLHDWMATTAVFFAEGAEFRSPESTALKLDRLAEFMRAMPDQRIQVIGHTDHVGSPDANAGVALDRAEAVIGEMARRGIPPERFDARPSPAQLKVYMTQAGPDSPNRRVEFALAYEGE